VSSDIHSVMSGGIKPGGWDAETVTMERSARGGRGGELTASRDEVSSRRTEHGLRRRWRTASLIMSSVLLLAVAGAAVTYIGMADRYRSTADDLAVAISQSASLNDAVSAHEGLSHELWQGTPTNMALYHRQERQIVRLFTVALRELRGSGEYAVVVQANKIWHSELASRGLFGAHAHARSGGGVTAEMQAAYGGVANQVYDLFAKLSQTAIGDGNRNLAAANRFLEIGIALLVAAFGLVLAFMLYFAHRLRTDVIRPVEALQVAAEKFRTGSLDHRVQLGRSQRPTEIEKLADAFNEMARDLLASHDELHRQAAYDGLTGLANRATFTERLTSYVDGLDRESEAVGVLFIDVDDFKNVNDSMGHAIGDKLLEAIARRLSGCVRGHDVLARLGGDEFAIITRGDTPDETSADVIAERVLSAFTEPFILAGRTLLITVSIGVSTLRPDTLDIASLISEADYAMYSAKRAGKGRHQIFNTLTDSIDEPKPQPARALPTPL
jgi:diguanylate cyclase (GGDEF)-like protein